MTHRLGICLDGIELISFEITGLKVGAEEICRILELLIPITKEKRQEAPLLQDHPTPVPKPTPVPNGPIANITPEVPVTKTGLPHNPIASPEEQARAFARGLLESGVNEPEAHKQTEAKFGSVLVRAARWRGWCNTWRAEGVLPKLEPKRPTTEYKPPAPCDNFSCLLPDVESLSAADCLEYQTRWNFSAGDVHVAWGKLACCRVCPNKKSRQDLEVGRSKTVPIGYNLSEYPELRF
jgi:hypothetical protein